MRTTPFVHEFNAVMHGLVTILSPPPIPRKRLNSHWQLSFWDRLTTSMKPLPWGPVQGPGKSFPILFLFRRKPTDLWPGVRRCPSDAWIFHVLPLSYSGYRAWDEAFLLSLPWYKNLVPVYDFPWEYPECSLLYSNAQMIAPNICSWCQICHLWGGMSMVVRSLHSHANSHISKGWKNKYSHLNINSIFFIICVVIITIPLILYKH
jgi:hypothetical protein